MHGSSTSVARYDISYASEALGMPLIRSLGGFRWGARFSSLIGFLPWSSCDSGDAKVPNVLQLAYIFHLLQRSVIKVFLVCAPSTIFFFFFLFLLNFGFAYTRIICCCNRHFVERMPFLFDFRPNSVACKP